MTAKLLTPTSLSAAIAAHADLPRAHLLAGGTELMPDQARGREATGYISLRAIADLSGIIDDDGMVRIGALTTVAAIRASALIAQLAPVLQQAARSLGSRQVRNRATIGGNVCAGGHQRSLVPALLALDAAVEIIGPTGVRTAALATVLTPTGPSLEDGEILTSVSFPAATGPQSYFRIGPRNAVCYATAIVALVIDEPAKDVRIALGGVSPAPMRAQDAEQIAASGIDWTRRSVPDDLARAAGDAAAAAADPVLDHVATPEYRRHAIGVMTRRALAHAFEEVPA